MPFALRRKKSRNIFFKILWLKKVLKKKKVFCGHLYPTQGGRSEKKVLTSGSFTF